MKYLLIRMGYAEGRSALYMMKQDDFRVSQVEVLGRGRFDRRKKILEVEHGDTFYVFSDWSVTEAN